MDVILERILSLVPKKPDGKYVHGAKKEFCRNIDAPENAISDWTAERSTSYKGYLHQIAAVYGVSVEWLKGETDEKTPHPADGAIGPNKKALYEAIDKMSRAELILLLERAEKIINSR